MIVIVPCLVCGIPIVQARKRVGRRLRFCSTRCGRLRHRLHNRRHSAALRQTGGGLKVQKPLGARPAPPSFGHFFSPGPLFEACADLDQLPRSAQPIDLPAFLSMRPAVAERFSLICEPEAADHD